MYWNTDTSVLFLLSVSVFFNELVTMFEGTKIVLVHFYWSCMGKCANISYIWAFDFVFYNKTHCWLGAAISLHRRAGHNIHYVPRDPLCPMDINPTLRNFKCLQLKMKVHDRIRTRIYGSEGRRLTDVLSRLGWRYRFF